MFFTSWPVYLPIHAHFSLFTAREITQCLWIELGGTTTWFITKMWVLWEGSKLKIAQKFVLKSLKIGKLVQFILKSFPAFIPFSLLGRTTSSFWWLCIFNNEFPMKSAFRTRFYKITLRIFILSSLPRKSVLNTIFHYDLTQIHEERKSLKLKRHYQKAHN